MPKYDPRAHRKAISQAAQILHGVARRVTDDVVAGDMRRLAASIPRERHPTVRSAKDAAFADHPGGAAQAFAVLVNAEAGRRGADPYDDRRPEDETPAKNA